MNATGKAEALRLLDDLVDIDRLDVPKYRKLQRLRSLLYAQGEAEPSAEDWMQAFVETFVDTPPKMQWKYARNLQQRARELARKGVGNE